MLFAVFYVQGVLVRDKSIFKPDVFIWGFVILFALVSWLTIPGNPINRSIEKKQLLDTYQSSFDVTVSDGGISVMCGTEDPFSILWEDILSCESYKQMVFIEYHERYNYLVIPEAAFSSEEQESALWEMFNVHIHANEEVS